MGNDCREFDVSFQETLNTLDADGVSPKAALFVADPFYSDGKHLNGPSPTLTSS